MTKGSRKRIEPEELSNLFEYRQGLHLKDTLLWFDSQRQRELCFVSHALVPGAFRHEKVLATEATSLLLRALAGAYGRGRQAHQPQLLVTPFHRTFSLGTLSLELFPSGYLLGSSSLLVTHRGLKIVYASTINPNESPLVDRLEARHCDVLVLPCGTSGPAAAQCESIVLPSAEEVTDQLLRFVDKALAEKQQPILLCPPLGEAQLLIQLLQQAGHRLRAHRQIFAACGVYQELRPDAFSIEQVRCYKRPIATSAKEVLLWPASLSSSEALLRHEQRRLALVGPTASDPQLRDALGVEAGFPISAAADYRGVLEYIDACQPVAVALTGGPATKALVDDLQAKGIETIVVGPQKQLPLL